MDRDVEILLDVIDAVTSAARVDEALERLAWLALRATAADRCAILVVDQQRPEVLRPAAGAARVGELEELQKRFSSMKPIRLVADLRRLLMWESVGATVLDDASRSPIVPAEWKRVWGSASLVFAPMRVGGELIGLLAVDRMSADERFGAPQVTMLERIANAAGMALRSARLVEQLQVRVRLTEALHRVAQSVVGTSDLKAALSALNSHLGAIVGAECTRLSLADPALAHLLRAPRVDEVERELIRAWRTAGHGVPAWSGGEAAFPVAMGRRVAGVLWIRASEGLDETGLEVVRAIAAGLGEVAWKAKLRRTAERRSQELAVAAERERIARDLHDTVGQTLFGIGLKLQDIRFRVEDPIVAACIDDVRDHAAQGVADVRSAAWALSSADRRERGFLPSLRALARRFTLATGVEASIRITPRFPSLPDDCESTLYGVAHEALSNVERHARATGVVLSLEADENGFGLTIRDDGIGLANRNGPDWRSSAHFGLRSMARSLEEVGGRLDVVRARPRGLLIRARVPASSRRRAR